MGKYRKNNYRFYLHTLAKRCGLSQNRILLPEGFSRLPTPETTTPSGRNIQCIARQSGEVAWKVGEGTDGARRQIGMDGFFCGFPAPQTEKLGTVPITVQSIPVY